jgi:hypothetical protein
VHPTAAPCSSPGVSEDAVQGFGVGAFNTAQSLLERLTDVGRHRPHVAPMAFLGYLESVVLGKERVLFVAVGLGQRRPYSLSWTSK